MSERKRPPSGARKPVGPRNSSERDPAYKVGRGRPPAECQWKPGVSGNKSGRRKGSKNRKTIVRAAERKTFTVTKGGRPRKLTTTEIGLHNLQQEVVRGDRKAFLDYLSILEHYSEADENRQSMQELLAEDRTILASLFARKSRTKPSEGEK
jgi:hypothetical protein